MSHRSVEIFKFDDSEPNIDSQKYNEDSDNNKATQLTNKPHANEEDSADNGGENANDSEEESHNNKIRPKASNRHLYQRNNEFFEDDETWGKRRTNATKKDSFSEKLTKKTASWFPVAFVMFLSFWGYYVYVFVLSIPAIQHGERLYHQVPKVIVNDTNITASLQQLYTSNPEYYYTNNNNNNSPHSSSMNKKADNSDTDDSQYTYERVMDKPSGAYAAMRVFAVIIFHCLFFMHLWTYWACILSNPGTIPPNFEGDYETMECKTDGRGSRKCDKCGGTAKPDRAHHCSVCKRCIRKMDHHCPWINNCVGWGNYKYFVLFLTYVVILCLYVFVSSLSWVITNVLRGHVSGSFTQVPMLFFFVTVFGFGLLIFAVTHYRMMLNNVTTIESFETRRKRRIRRREMQDEFIVESEEDLKKYNPYDLGARHNFRQVFGTKPILWFIPYFTSLGDGMHFEVNDINNNHAVVATTRSTGNEEQMRLLA